MSSRGGGGGGHATAAGVQFQTNVAADLVVGMLAERAYEPPWRWPRDATIESVRVETSEPTDDIFAATSHNGRAYIQAKNSLALGATATSEFGKTVAQLTDQYLACRDRTDGRTPLDPDNDRLVISVGTGASGSVRESLRNVLNRVRDWPSDKPLLDAASADAEQKALETTITHIKRAVTARDKHNPGDDELRRILSLITVSTHDFAGDDGAAQRAAVGLLRTSVVADTNRAGDAWNALRTAVTAHAARQSGLDRHGAQEVLRRESIALVAPRSYREDIAALRTRTDRTLAVLSDLADIALRDGRVKIAREAPQALLDHTENTSCLVVGDPGGGKSATLYEFALLAQAAGADVVALAADQLDSGSLGSLRTELNLDRDILDVLENWPTERGVLLIDALDAARGDGAQQALLDLIAAVCRHAPQWTVVASIRRFDLRHNHNVRTLFPVGNAVAEDPYVDHEFFDLSHFCVARLSDGELAQLADVMPNVHAFLENATEQMHQLVRTPFNLRLLAQLLDADIAPDELHPITTQLQLLERYWQLRVLEPTATADLREALLRRVCELIVSTRSMRVHRADIQTEPALLPALNDTLSLQLLVENTGADGTVDRDILAFAHHVLLDYAAARVLLRHRDATDVAAALVADRQMSIVIRPSIDLHLRWLWSRDDEHDAFWELVFAIAEQSNMEIATVVGTSVAAELARTLGDLAPLIAAIRSDESARQVLGELTLGHVLASVETLDLGFVGAHAGPWAALAAELSTT
jgi:hypothetical protein